MDDMNRDPLWARRIGETKRWHALPMHNPTTVGHHTFNILLNVMITLKDPRVEFLRYIILHDAPEFLVGDAPRGAKNPQNEKRELEVLTLICNELSIHREEKIDLTDTEAELFETLDLFDALEEMISNVMMGNRRIEAGLDEALISFYHQLSTLCLHLEHDESARLKARIRPVIQAYQQARQLK